MSSIKSLIIPCVEYEYTHEYIANAFWKQSIARVSSVTLIPYIKGEWVYYIAYINIDCWCDSENAYNFIKKLNNPHKETRLVHYEDNWWSVEQSVNTFAIRDATVQFEPSYYEKFVKEEEEYEEEEELTSLLTDDSFTECGYDYQEMFLKYPICGLYGDRYTVEDAEELLNALINSARSGLLYNSKVIEHLKEKLEQYKADREWNRRVFETPLYA